MPQFRYRALNSQGHELEGTLSAPDANAAVVQLGRQGLRLKSIEESVSVVHVAPPQIRLTSPSGPAYQAVHQVPSPRAQSQAAPRFGKKGSPRSTYNDRQFLFAQLSGLLRSGISPADALYTILSRSGQGKFSAQFDEMAKMCSEGMSLADAMSHYPDMFPDGIVGAVRAGEAGGYLPDACETVSIQQKQTRPIFWYFAGILLLMPLFIVGVMAGIAMAAGINSGIDAIRDGTNESAFVDTLVAHIRTIGIPVTLLLFGGGVLCYFVFRGRALRGFRHRVGLAVPPFRWRAYNENLAHFSFHLCQLSKSGLSPFASWNLSARAVPNLAYSRRLVAMAENLNERTKLSELLYRTKLFPRESAQLVETGEMTGDLPRALDQVMDIGRQREKLANVYIGAKAGCWTMMLLFIGPTIIVMIIYLTYMRGVWRIVE
jgi:general secretion pathway protein F